MTGTLELLPCPFCGGDKICTDYIRDGASIHCLDCKGSICAFLPDAREKAIAAWNTRTPDPVAEEVLDALERCDQAIQAWWKSETDVNINGLAVIEAGRLAAIAKAKARGE